eukprot:Sdes_comp16212_c0_seq1m5479
MSSFLSLSLPSYFEASSGAIPELARNFLGAYMSDGVKEETPEFDSQITEILNNSKNNGLYIRVLGVPQSGAKSRVETQIKFCIQVVTSNGDKMVGCNKLVIPDSLLSKEKNVKAKRVELFDDAKSLFLEVKVVCSSNLSQEVLSCFGCVQRERTRLERKLEHNHTLQNSLTEVSPPKKIIDDIESDRKKIIVFNSSPVVDFSRGDTILPARITCYCRHHDEKVGFCVCFTMKDSSGKVVASGISPPILITDDHKSSRVKGTKRSRIGDGIFDESLSPQIPSDLFLGEKLSPKLISSEPLPSLSSIFDCFSPNTNPTSSPLTPSVFKVIPSEGPIHGGMECTVLGSSFVSGMTVIFGENEAYPTHCWGSNTLICVVPPAIVAGNVRISIRNYFPSESSNVMFTYKDHTDQAVMELALQVVGLKMTGRIDDAKQIARHIVDQNTSEADSAFSSSWSTPSSPSSFHVISHRRHEFELMILSSLRLASNFQTAHMFDVSLQSSCTHHSLLHFAAFKRYDRLMEFLLERDADVDAQDRNGFTALHYAVWKGNEFAVRLLLAVGACAYIENNDCLTPADFATSHSRLHGNIKLLLCEDISETESSDDAETSSPHPSSHRYSPPISTHNSETNMDRSHKSNKRRPLSEVYNVPLSVLYNCLPITP